MDNLTVALLQLNGGVRGLANVQAAAGVTPGEARLADEARKLFFFFFFFSNGVLQGGLMASLIKYDSPLALFLCQPMCCIPSLGELIRGAGSGGRSLA